MRRIVTLLGFPTAAVLVLAILAQAADPAFYPPKAGAPVVDVYVVDHGYHAGLIVPVNRLYAVALQDGRLGALATPARRIVGHRYVELGWGDEGFYRARSDHRQDRVGTCGRGAHQSDAAPGPACRRLRPGAGCRPSRHSTLLRLTLSDAGFARLVARYDETVPVSAEDEPEDLGPGLYGDSEFYRAAGIYNGLNDCNQWVAHLLAAAGVPASRSTSTTSFGLMSELRWRAGASSP